MAVPTSIRTPAGHLGGRSLLHQLARFASTGAMIACLYLGLTALLAHGLGVPFQISLAVGYFTAVLVHFVMHRRFVFANEQGFELSARAQFVRFVVVVLAQYAVTAGSVEVLPGALNIDRTIVWLGTVAVVTVISFVVLRSKLFHPRLVTLDA